MGGQPLPQFLAIVVYKCLVAGVPTQSLDFQVRWFEADDETAVNVLIEREPTQSYLNPYGEEVTWELFGVFAIDSFAPGRSGDEVVGFISSIQELENLN